jgi:hypothetical protein
MSPQVLEFAKKLAQGARAKAAEDHRRFEAIRKAQADQQKATPPSR